jgi:SAM-dependent methyltransferase
MHPVIFAAFNAICLDKIAPGARVLEIGAMPTQDTLLRLPALPEASLRVGTNREAMGPADGVNLVQVGDASLACFADASFDAVLCNSALEHDPAFWRTLTEIDRVARPGALIVIGVPGYTDMPPPRLLRWTRWAPIARWLDRIEPSWLATTPTLVVHNYPGDYYRFSPQAMREVLMAGCTDIHVDTVLRPPRIIGSGRRRGAPSASRGDG